MVDDRTPRSKHDYDDIMKVESFHVNLWWPGLTKPSSSGSGPASDHALRSFGPLARDGAHAGQDLGDAPAERAQSPGRPATTRSAVGARQRLRLQTKTAAKRLQSVGAGERGFPGTRLADYLGSTLSATVCVTILPSRTTKVSLAYAMFTGVHSACHTM